jgi:hypothetical protein
MRTSRFTGRQFVSSLAAGCGVNLLFEDEKILADLLEDSLG